jgi:phage shock protein PspC (stress-responsive transcriptional regulator)
LPVVLIRLRSLNWIKKVMNTPLYRSRDNAMIAGVCAGLGEYLGIDASLVRLFFLLIALAGNGIGLLVYFLLWIIVPLEGSRRDSGLGDHVRAGSLEIADRARDVGTDLQQMVRNPNPQAGLIFGSALVILGGIFLLQNLNLPWLGWLDLDVVWPVLLIAGGITLLLRHLRGG